MEIEKNDMVMVYDGGGTVPHCKYTGRFGDLTAYWQEIVSDAVYLFRLGESEECDWLVLLGQPWSPYSRDGIRYGIEGGSGKRCPSFSMYISRERVNG